LLVTSKKLIIRNGKDATIQERAKIAQLAHEVIAGKEMFSYSGKPELANEDGLAEASFWRNLNECEDQPEIGDNLQQSYQNSFVFYQIEESGEPKQLECDNISTLVLDTNQVDISEFFTFNSDCSDLCARLWFRNLHMAWPQLQEIIGQICV
jgi:hypothetical protein